MNILNKRFLFFGGKGGVGKTTMAAATAILSAESGKKTLLVSTDPAHSVSDSLDQLIGGDTYKKVEGVDNLYAIELNTEKSMNEYSEIVKDQDPSGIFSELLGGEDASALSPPGADETVAFMNLLEFIENPEFDVVVFDTAPTGHTLNLLKLPELTESWLYRTIKLRNKMSGLLKGFKTLFGGGSGPSEQEAFDQIEVLKERVGVARELLSNTEETEFIAVTIPTIMAIWETERLVNALHDVKFPITQIIINQIQPPNENCSFCNQRYENHKKDLKRIYTLYDEFKLIEIPLFDHELRGI